MVDPQVAATATSGDGAGLGRRRWRSRKHRSTRGPSSSTPVPSLGESDDALTDISGEVDRRDTNEESLQRPCCVIRRSPSVAPREEPLAKRALVLSVIADDPESLTELIAPAIAHRFEIDVNLLSIVNLGTASFLLISPDEHMATRIFNRGRPISVPPGRLHVMRWSRFFQSSAEIFPTAMDVELRGIPAHAWELETVSQLLGDHCVPGAVHPDAET